MSLLCTGCRTDCECYPRDCQDIQTLGFADSGKYHVIPDKHFNEIEVYCDLVTDGGGWLVFQRRVDGSEDFFRGWDDYDKGFGDINGEHWLGNTALHAITSQGSYELRVELGDFNGNTSYAKYRHFEITDFKDSYRLWVSGYSGDAGDSLTNHNTQVFSTYDNDATVKNCSTLSSGAWWYKGCHASNLNGLYLHGTYNESYLYKSINWFSWDNTYQYPLKTTEMKVRRL